MLWNVLMLRFCNVTGVLYYPYFAQIEASRGPWAFFTLLTFVRLALKSCTTFARHLFKKTKSALLNTAYKGQIKYFLVKSTKWNRGNDRSFPDTLQRKSALFCTFWSKSKKVRCKAIDFLWKKTALFGRKIKGRPMQRSNKKCKNALLCIFVLFKVN